MILADYPETYQSTGFSTDLFASFTTEAATSGCCNFRETFYWTCWSGQSDPFKPAYYWYSWDVSVAVYWTDQPDYCWSEPAYYQLQWDASVAVYRTSHPDYYQSDKAKGKSATKTMAAAKELAYFMTFIQSITQAMGRTLQDLCDSVFINLTNLTLIRCGSYLDYYIPRRKSGIYWIQVRRAAAAAVEISLWTR